MTGRVERVQGLRSSGAAGPHKGRDPRVPLTDDEAIQEGTVDHMTETNTLDYTRPLDEQMPADVAWRHYRMPEGVKAKPDVYATDGINNQADTCQVWTLHVHAKDLSAVVPIVQQAMAHSAFGYWLAPGSWDQWCETPAGDWDIHVAIYFEAPLHPNYEGALTTGRAIYELIDQGLLSDDTWTISTSGDWSIQL